MRHQIVTIAFGRYIFAQNFQQHMKTYSYPYLLTWIAKLLEGINTSHTNEDDDNKNVYIELNLKRMERLDKTIVLQDEVVKVLEKIEQPQQWIVITEAWCGDSAQSLPYIHKMAEVNPEKIKLDIILRDENMDVMKNYQTKGTNSIPILVCRDEEGNDLFVWGPRPATANSMFNEWKNSESRKEEFELQLHTWYTQDKGNEIQLEIKDLIEKL